MKTFCFLIRSQKNNFALPTDFDHSTKVLLFDKKKDLSSFVNYANYSARQATMSHDRFQFKQFDVEQQHCAMKVGTDGVLLGALATPAEGRVLDIGTGSGVVALMMAQRCEAEIWGLELDEEAADDASENFRRSPWAQRLHVVRGDLKDFHPQAKFNLIVSNPPFYRHSPQASSAARAAARSARSLPYPLLARRSAELLALEGRLQVILPYSEAESFRMTCWDAGLHLTAQTDIRTKAAKPLSRAVQTFALRPQTVRREELCLLNDDGTRSEAYRRLTQDFYIK